MDLRQLSYLVAVADEGGIRPAARRLHIAQPQISLALRRLEDELGVTLLHRSARGTELTPAGEELVAHGREILTRVSTARAAARARGATGRTALRVGVLAGVLSAGELLAPILEGWRAARPDVELHLEDLTFRDQVPLLVNGDLDAAIVRVPVVHPELVLVPIATEPRVLMVGVQHPLAGAEEVGVDEAVRYPTLPLDAPPEWAAYWQLDEEAGGSRTDGRVAPVRTVPDSQLVIATHGLLVSSPATVGRLAPNPLIRTVRLQGAAPSVIAVAHRRHDRRRTLHEFVDVARRTAAGSIDVLPGGAVPATTS